MDFIWSFVSTGIKKKYEVGEVIGKGKFSVVKLGKYKETGKTYAIKCIQKKTCKLDQERLELELEIMKKVHHPNCIQFHEVFQSRNKMYIVMEHVSGGELFDRIIEKEHYNEGEAAIVATQLLDAVAYLHSIDVVHRDIKPENVLYANKSDDSPVKLADFGLGKILDVHGGMMSTMCGTPAYLAPELIKQSGYTDKVDVWSSGVLLYILLCGCPPFGQDLSMPVLFDRIKRGYYFFPEPQWHGVSKEAIDLVSKMMTVNPEKRLTAAQCLAHPWFKKSKEKKLPVHGLAPMQERLKEWNTARRMKGAVNAVTALTKYINAAAFTQPSPPSQQHILEQVRADKERLLELRESFDLLDKDKTGRISVKNISKSLADIGAVVSEEFVQYGLTKYDFKHQGTMDFDEFCIMMGPDVAPGLARSLSGELELRTVFDFFDADRTGVIGPNQLKDALRKIGARSSDDEVRNIMQLADTNMDGQIDFAEFSALCNKHFLTTDIDGADLARVKS